MNLNPGSVIAADLDGDSNVDLAMSHVSGLSVLLNQGDGNFADAVTYALGYRSGFLITAADFNGDGSLDLAKVVGSGFSVLINDRKGIFTTLTTYAAGQGPTSLIALDLNGDRKLDVAMGNSGSDDVAVLLNHTTSPFSLDLNHNNIPDECEQVAFHRADPNSTGTTDLSDAIGIFGFLFLGSDSLTCIESADVNNDGTIDISDGIGILNWLFAEGPEPAPPGPSNAPCGFDPDSAGSAGDLGCEAYQPCA